jgi:hypothetical protein
VQKVAAAMRQSSENGKMMSRLLERINVGSDGRANLTSVAHRRYGGAPATYADARVRLDEHGLDTTFRSAGYCAISEFHMHSLLTRGFTLYETMETANPEQDRRFEYRGAGARSERQR